MHKVVLSRQARRYYAEASGPIAQRLAHLFLDMEQNPLPQGTKKLQGKLAGLWRIRVGELRVIFEVAETEIRIIKIGPRGDIYS